VKEFPGETNFSVITGDGSFFSFNVVYKEEPSTLNINMDQWMNPDEGEKKGGSPSVSRNWARKIRRSLPA